MFKKIVSVALIVIFSSGWIYLDHLNRLQIKEAEELRKSMEIARAKALALAKVKFEATILADLTTCKNAAEQANADYLTQNQKPVRRKPGQFTIPQSVADEASKILETANATCQATYDTRLKNGS